MTFNDKVQKEADKYKNLSQGDLKKVIRGYKSLSRSNSDIYNFLFSFTIMMVMTILCFKITVGILFLMTLIHYLFFWEYLHKYKKSKLVSDEDKEEIDAVIKILEGYIQD